MSALLVRQAGSIQTYTLETAKPALRRDLVQLDFIAKDVAKTDQACAHRVATLFLTTFITPVTVPSRIVVRSKSARPAQQASIVLDVDKRRTSRNHL